MREGSSSSRRISLLYLFPRSVIEDIGVFFVFLLAGIFLLDIYLIFISTTPTTPPVITSAFPIHGGLTRQRRPSIVACKIILLPPTSRPPPPTCKNVPRLNY